MNTNNKNYNKMIGPLNKTLPYLVILLVLAPLVQASNCSPWIAKAVSVQGKVETINQANPTWHPVKQDDEFCRGEKIRTGKWSRATIRLNNESLVDLDQSSTLVFAKAEQKSSNWLLNLFEGNYFFRSRRTQHLDINTPFINAVHEGTEFLVSVDQQHAEIAVFDGQVAGFNRSGKIQISKGNVGSAQQNQAPRLLPLTVKPEDAVQWALYYPPIVNFSVSNPAYGASQQAYQQGNIAEALANLEAIPANQQDSAHWPLKAALLLSVGRTDEAGQILAEASASQRKNGDVQALQAIIAVTKNQHQQALDLAIQAETNNPTSATAKIALSYAYQAQYNIEKALKAAEQATQLAPNNALAWARLAELQLSVGDQKSTLYSAQKAQNLNPAISRTQTVLGFAKLARTDITGATSVFQQAIKLDSSDPLARLGLGLAKIRQGNIEAGKTELEIAANLDPNNAVIRSYLGKAFYELRDKEFAGTEYNIAKEADPKDPTPWFYDAILKQTTNRPIEALQDMQKAIELNGNRGVYRSKLLLDSDSAARSASLGRIYNDLGFQQRGLLEGWKSINSDPSNYSAHRLLSDNYAVLPRHEIARVSELLKAQLLQPINLTPVQPHSTDSNILILDGLGSSVTSFNEYNSMYARNRLGLQASGYVGSNSSYSDEVVQSGIWNNWSYSVGQFHYSTDGFRENNDLEKDSYNLFVQNSITPDTNVQFEYRHSDQESGDIAQSFFNDQFSAFKRENKETNTIRGGLHQALAPNSDLLMSLIYNHQKTKMSDFNEPFPGLTISERSGSDADGLLYEFQHLYRSQFYDLTSGFGHLLQSSDESALQITNFFDTEGPFTQNNSPAIDHDNLYLYSNIKPVSDLIISLGLSLDLYQKNDHGKFEREPLNPKFGLTWQASPDTTVRLAAFRSFKRSLVENQTLEPTQIAGFNQFFDDQTGTNSERVGFGMDHKFTKHVLTGVELSLRRLDVPFDFITFIPDTADISAFVPVTEHNNTIWQEQNARAYVNWMPNQHFSLSGEYQYEKLNRNNKFFFPNNNFLYLETHRPKVSGNFFHPSGLIIKTSLSFIDQAGDFIPPNFSGSDPISAKNQFWLLDTELGYRFSKRHGLIYFGIKNLLDEQFNYQGIDANQSGLPHDRFFYSRLTLSF